MKSTVLALGVALLLLSRGNAGESPATFQKEGEIKTGGKLAVSLPDLRAGEYYGLTVSLPNLSELGETEAIEVAISDAKGILTAKTLHAGDPDLTTTIRPRVPGEGKVEATASGSGEKTHRIEVYLSRMELSGKGGVLIGANPSNDWRSAQPIELGKPVRASTKRMVRSVF